jgi:putative glutamine amidotransferase
MQILNVALGGDLFQHLPDALPEAMPHRRTVAPEGGGAMQAVPVPHDVDVDPGSQLAAVLEVARASVMSLHHQAVDEPGDGLAVVARAPDGVIEGMEMPEHPWLLAVQWHPELLAAGDPVQQRLFVGLVQAAAGAR